MAVAPTYVGTVGPAGGHAAIYPTGIDVDPSGTLYVADTGNDQVAAFDASGNQQWRTGTRAFGPPGLGQFLRPADVAYLGGKLYVADAGNNRVEVLDAATGTPQALWSAHFVGVSGITAGVDGSNNPVLVVTDSATSVVEVFSPQGGLGATVGSGHGSGPGQLSSPRDAATDSSGNIYVADSSNNRVARFTAGGVWIGSWGKPGSTIGKLNRPFGIAVDSASNVYVGDSLNSRIERFDQTGTATAVYGSAGSGAGQFVGLRGVAVGAGATPEVYGADLLGYKVDEFANGGPSDRTFGGSGPSLGGLNEPMAVAADASGVFVVDTANQRIQSFDSSGTPQGAWPGGGFGNGYVGLAWPRGVALSLATNTLWVADTLNQRILEYSRSGVPTTRSLGGPGSAVGKLLAPSGVVAYQANVAVADSGNNRVQMFNPATKQVIWSYAGLRAPRALAVLGTTLYVADTGNHQIVRLRAEDGSLIDSFGASQLQQPGAVTVALNGHVWVADALANQLLEFGGDGSYLQTFGSTGSQPGQFNGPAGLAIVPNGASPRLMVADAFNDRVQIFSLNLLPAAPPGTGVYDHDMGVFATAEITPTDVVRDSNGFWYVDDAGLFCIKVFSPDGTTLLRTIFTCGVKGLDNTHIAQSRGMGIDPNTNELWVGDTVNNRILKLQTDGTVEFSTTVADNTVGPPLNGPVDVTVDNQGNAYIVDAVNRVVAVTASGAFSHQWGSTGSGQLNLNTPAAIAYSGVGGDAVYVTDANNFRVQKFSLDGSFRQTFGQYGTANGRFTKDARGIAVDGSGIIYASDIGGNRIVRWSPTGTPLTSLGGGLPYYRNGPTDFYYGSRGIFIAGNTLAVADLFNYRVLLWSLAGQGLGQIGGSAPPVNGHNLPHGVALDASGNLYVSDYWHQWIQKYAPDGTLLARWGLGRGSGPGTLNFPGGIAVDSQNGWLYIANRESNVVDRWRTSDGGFDTRFSLPGGPLTGKAWPRGVSVDPTTHNFAVPDEKNNTVLVLSSTGTVLRTLTTYGTSQPIGSPQAVAYDEQGNLYVADGSPGTGGGYFLHVYGPSGAWTQDIAVADPASGLTEMSGFLYVVSATNSNVGIYSTSGSLVTRWSSYGMADGQLNQPYTGIAVDPAGNLYVGDTFNHRVKVFRPAP